MVSIAFATQGSFPLLNCSRLQPILPSKFEPTTSPPSGIFGTFGYGGNAFAAPRDKLCKLEELTPEMVDKMYGIQFWNPDANKWEDTNRESLACALRRGLTSNHLARAMNHHFDPRTFMYHCNEDPSLKDLKGDALFERIFKLKKQEREQAKEHLAMDEFFFGSTNRCYGGYDAYTNRLDYLDTFSENLEFQRCSDEHPKCDPNKPNALSLIGSSEVEILGDAPLLSFRREYALSQNCGQKFLYRISKVYNLCARRIRKLGEFCSFIKARAIGRPISLLTLDAHGWPFGISFDAKQKAAIDTSSDLSCLTESLAPNATVILSSCSTGNGREEQMNMANHIMNHLPQGARVIAPQFDFMQQHRDIKSLQPRADIRFTVGSNDVTYTVDSSQPGKHCPKYGLSKTLAFCNKSPFLSVSLRRMPIFGDLYDAMEFYQATTKTWSPVSRETIEFISEHDFSDRELQKISQSDWSLEQFAARAKTCLERAASIGRQLSNEELTDGILNSTFWQRRAADLAFDVLAPCGLCVNTPSGTVFTPHPE